MELSTFSENVVTEVFTRNGEGIELQINIDALTPEFHEFVKKETTRISKQFDKKLSGEVQRVRDEKRKSVKGRAKKDEPEVTPFDLDISLDAEFARARREIAATFLTCPVKIPTGETRLLKDWDLTENGKPLAVSKELLLTLPPRLVEELWLFCVDKANTVKKRVESETRETSELTHDGSTALRVVGQGT